MAKSKKSTTETIAQQLEETAAVEETNVAEVVETEETTTPVVEETKVEEKKNSIWAEGEHRIPKREGKKEKKPNYTSDHLKDSDTSSINFGLNSIF